MKKNNKIIVIAEVAIFAAIGFALDFLATLYSGYLFPNGGSLSLALIPIIIISIRRGPVAGLSCGLIIGLLDLTDGFYSYSDVWYKAFIQIFVDYILAYPLAGICSLIKPLFKNVKFPVVVTIISIIAGLAKYFVHFLSGILFWPEFPGQPFFERCWYSIIYNGSYMLPTILVTAVIMCVFGLTYKKIFETNK